MKRWYTVLFVFLAGCLVAGAALTEDEMETLEDYVDLAAVNDDDYEDENEVEYFELTFRTSQRSGTDFNKYNFVAKVFIELEDKKTDTLCHVQGLKQKKNGGDQYTGTDKWRVLVPYGDMKRPKLAAYVVQYGVLVDGEFIVIVEDKDDVETIEELLDRSDALEGADVLFQHQLETQNNDGEPYYTNWQ